MPFGTGSSGGGSSFGQATTAPGVPAPSDDESTDGQPKEDE